MGRRTHAGPTRPWRDNRAALPPRAPSATLSAHDAARALLELRCAAGGDWDASIRDTVRLDAETLHVERVSFWTVCDVTSSMRCDAGYVASSPMLEHGATLLKADFPAYFDAIHQARILTIEDVDTDPRTRDLRDYFAARAISSTLAVPVRVDGRLAGVLCHEHVGSRRRWSIEEEDFAAGVGLVVSAALTAHAHTCAAAAAQRAAFLDNVSRLSFQSLDAKEIASRVVGLVLPTLGDASVVWTRNRYGDLEFVASTHVDPRKREVVIEMARANASDPEPSLPTHVVRQNQSLLLPDASPSVLERYGVNATVRSSLARLGISTVMGVPLAVAGKAFGAISFGAANRHYGADDLALAEDVAARVSAALENARLYDVAREAIRARDDFLVLASHELRTPLTALQLLTQDTTRRGQRGGEGGETTRGDVITRQVGRLVALVDRMLNALRIRGEGVSAVRDSCDLATLVEARVRSVAERARRAGCAIAVSAEPSVVGLWDRARLEQVVDELLDNAIKFSGSKPIEVAVTRDETEAVLTLRDHGIGIPADRQSSIFSPFDRGVSKNHFGGLGLGLYVARAIVEAHGGSIALNSDLGNGTTFVVRLPLAMP